MNVSAATAGERDAALGLLVAHRPPADRDRAIQVYRDLFSSGGLDPAGLFVARGSRDTVRGTMLVSAEPGALGLAWAPATVRRFDRQATEDALVSAACEWLKQLGVKVCQAFGGEHDRESFAPLERAGFTHLTNLTELRGELNDKPPPHGRLSFEPFAADRPAFHRTMFETFTGSLDCPEVNGSRTDEELIATYRDSDPEPQSWFLAKLDGEPAGVVLLELEAESEFGVLTYLGLAPKFRGRGLGSELVHFARRTARIAGRAALALCVDERNAPALHLYKRLGFQASGARSVFLADWPKVS